MLGDHPLHTPQLQLERITRSGDGTNVGPKSSAGQEGKDENIVMLKPWGDVFFPHCVEDPHGDATCKEALCALDQDIGPDPGSLLYG